MRLHYTPVMYVIHTYLCLYSAPSLMLATPSPDTTLWQNYITRIGYVHSCIYLSQMLSSELSNMAHVHLCIYEKFYWTIKQQHYHQWQFILNSQTIVSNENLHCRQLNNFIEHVVWLLTGSTSWRLKWQLLPFQLNISYWRRTRKWWWWWAFTDTPHDHLEPIFWLPRFTWR